MSLRDVRAATQRAGVDTRGRRTKSALCDVLPVYPRTTDECDPVPSRGGRRMRSHLIDLAQTLGIDTHGLRKHEICQRIVEATSTEAETVTNADEPTAPLAPTDTEKRASEMIEPDARHAIEEQGDNHGSSPARREPINVAIAAAQRAANSRYDASVTLEAATQARAALADAERQLADATTAEQRAALQQQAQRVAFLANDLRLRAAAAQREVDAYGAMVRTFQRGARPAIFFDFDTTLARNPLHELLPISEDEPPTPELLESLFPPDHLAQLLDLFARLRSRGVAIFVLTANHADAVQAVLARIALAPYVEHVLGSDVLQYVRKKGAVDESDARVALVQLYLQNGTLPQQVAFVDHNTAHRDAAQRVLGDGVLGCCNDDGLDVTSIQQFYAPLPLLEATQSMSTRTPVPEPKIPPTLPASTIKRYNSQLQVLRTRLQDDGGRAPNAIEQEWLSTVDALFRKEAAARNIAPGLTPVPTVATVSALCTALLAST